VADDEVEALLDAGLEAGERLSADRPATGTPVQLERTEFHDQDGYWKTFWDEDDVF
jgi:hypothetical protein